MLSLSDPAWSPSVKVDVFLILLVIERLVLPDRLL